MLGEELQGEREREIKQQNKSKKESMRDMESLPPNVLVPEVWQALRLRLYETNNNNKHRCTLCRAAGYQTSVLFNY